MTQLQKDLKFLEVVITELVENPDSISIERTIDEMGVLLTLKVHKDDMAQVIGKSGRTASAIRTLLRVIGMKNNSRVNLKIEEPEGGIRENDTEQIN